MIRASHATHVHTALSHILKRISYPISKEELIEFVRLEGTGDDVVDVVSRLPPRTYHSPDEVFTTLKKC